MGLRDLLRKKTDSKKTGEAATKKDPNVVANQAPADIPFGLDVWVEGVDPIVEYVSPEVFSSLAAADPRPGL
jgi:hypothetical protein